MISTIYASDVTETLYLFSSNSSFSLPEPLATTNLPSASMSLTVLDTS